MFSKIMKLVALVFLMFIASCTNENLPAGARGEAFQLADKQKENEVINIMEKRGIPFNRNDRGYIIYLLENQAEVHGILRVVEYGEIANPSHWESAILVNDLVKNKYLSAFESANIPYDISEHNDIVQINWNQTFGRQVDLIRQQIAEEISKGIKQ